MWRWGRCCLSGPLVFLLLVAVAGGGARASGAREEKRSPFSDGAARRLSSDASAVAPGEPEGDVGLEVERQAVSALSRAIAAGRSIEDIFKEAGIKVPEYVVDDEAQALEEEQVVQGREHPVMESHRANGHGSGSVLARLERLGAIEQEDVDAYRASDGQCTLFENTDYYGNDIKFESVKDIGECCKLCEEHPDCVVFSILVANGLCHLKSSDEGVQSNDGCLAGRTAAAGDAPIPPPKKPAGSAGEDVYEEGHVSKLAQAIGGTPSTRTDVTVEPNAEDPSQPAIKHSESDPDAVIHEPKWTYKGDVRDYLESYSGPFDEVSVAAGFHDGDADEMIQRAIQAELDRPHTRPPHDCEGYDCDFNSRGKVGEWCQGDMQEPGVLKECFAKCSYKKELVMIVGDVGKGDLAVDELFINRVLNLQDMGFDHWIAFTNDVKMCSVMRKWFPNGGCIYSSLRDRPGVPGRVSINFLWPMRWFLFSRAIQLGYNVLMIDLDVDVVSDPYKYLKHPGTFGKINLLSMMDAWPQPEDLPRQNGGGIYVQNAAPNGPAAWIGAEVTQRWLRWGECELMNPFSPNERPRHFDQDVVSDAICSVIGRVPTAYKSFVYNKDAPGQAVTEAEMTRAIHRACDMRKHGRFEEWTTPTDDDWTNKMWMFEGYAYAGEKLETLLGEPYAGGFPEKRMRELEGGLKGVRGRWLVNVYDIGLPVVPDGRWDPALGGEMLPAPSCGELSQEMWDLLEVDGTKRWPDPVAAGDPDGAREIRETWMPMAVSMFGNFGNSGRSVPWWSDPNPPVSIAHWVAAWPGQNSKTHFTQVYGWWHWETRLIMFGNQPFRASTPQHPIPRTLGWPLDFKLNAPDHTTGTTLPQFPLLFASMLAGRTPNLPELDCDSPFMGRCSAEKPAGGDTYGHAQCNSGYEPKGSYVTVLGNATHPRCYSVRHSDAANNLYTLMPQEFEHMLTLIPASVGEPSAANTIWWDEYSTQRQRGAYKNAWPADAVEVTEDELVELLAPFADQHVVYLGQLVRIVGAVSEGVLHAFKEFAGAACRCWIEFGSNPCCHDVELKNNYQFLSEF